MTQSKIIALIFILTLVSCAPRGPVSIARATLIEALSDQEKMLKDADFEYQYSEIQVLDNELIPTSPSEIDNEIQGVRCISFRYISKYSETEPWMYRIAIVKSLQYEDGSWQANLQVELDNDLSMSEEYDKAWAECNGAPFEAN